MSKLMSPYDRTAAVAYAHRWSHARNPTYYNYEKIGGDCTNFVSQCLFAGAGVMNYNLTGGWYYINANNKSPSWSGVEFLRSFLVRTGGGLGPMARETAMTEMAPGDVIQLLFDGKVFKHSLFVVEPGDAPAPDTILVATHTDDQDNYPLSSFQYEKIRFLHILGVLR